MLYLEDYLEMIEQLPMDLRDRFTEMREMDLQVQNATDQLEQKVIEFFVNAKKNKPEWREEQMEVIKKDYYKALEDADEKVQLANQIYDLVNGSQMDFIVNISNMLSIPARPNEGKTHSVCRI
uniref:Inhibitor of growth family, member 3 n=1 Tax=Mastacembelus armatus TaxID=205130 RepID=A0A7N8XGZ4_9TELE